MAKKPDLKLIKGGRESAVRIGPCLVVPGTPAYPPFPVSILIYAEDTWRVMSTGSMIVESKEHPVRLSTDLIAQCPEQPGDLLCKGQRWLAIIYDLDQQPICREQWVAQAIDKILINAAKKDVHSVGMPLLGSEQGVISWQRSFELICECLREATEGPERIWIPVSHYQLDEAWRLLRAQKFSAGGVQE